jgi:hypothetical protein
VRASAIHFAGGLSWWEGRWKITKLSGFAACRQWTDAADTGLGTKRVNSTRDGGSVTCKRCLAFIVKAAANQEQRDRSPKWSESAIGFL